MKYFFDTYAIFEIIKKNKNYEKFFGQEILTSVLNLGELYYGLLKDYGNATALEWFAELKNLAIPIDVETIKLAMEFKHSHKNKNFSFIDCVGYVIAKEHGLIFLTGDKEFENLKNVEFIK